MSFAQSVDRIQHFFQSFLEKTKPN